MRKRLVAAALLSAAVTLVGAPAEAADNNFECTGIVTAGVFDNVIVPGGQTCRISTSQVRGNIKALPNSRLFLQGGNTIGGNVEGDKAIQVSIFNDTEEGVPPNVIHGNGVLVDGSLATFSCGAVLPKGNIIVVKSRGSFLGIGGLACAAGNGGGNIVQQGNIKVEDTATSTLFEVSDNLVGQSVQVYKNSSTAFSMRVQNNTAGESVQCFDNVGTFVGGPNTAPEKEGQCF